MKKAIIIGAGITGLRIGLYLSEAGYDVKVFEKTAKSGGMCSSFQYKDMIVDYGPHKFYTQLPGVYDDFKYLIGEGNYLTVKKVNTIRLLGKYFDFPVKISQLVLNINPFVSFKIFLDLMKEKLTKREVKNYQDYFTKGFGKTGYELVFKGFAEKVWGNPQNLAEELARRRSPASSIVDVLKTALKRGSDVSADYFLYPKKGYGDLGNKTAEKLIKNGGKIITESQVLELKIKKDKVDSIVWKDKNGKKKVEKCDVVVSTMAIDVMHELMRPRPPKEIVDYSNKLKFRSLIIAYVVLNKERALKANWIFFPEKEYCFNRVAEQKSFSDSMIPKNKTVLTAEITCNLNDSTYKMNDEEIRKMVVKDLVKADLIKDSDVIEVFSRRAGKVYPVYDIKFKENREKVLEYLNNIKNFYANGRLGLFNYNNADHCLDMAKVTSEIIINNKSREDWKKAIEYFDNYRIVD